MVPGGQGLIPVGDMAALHESRHFHRPARTGGDGFQLGQGPVLVLQALDEQDRDVDVRQAGFDVPVPETRVQPGIAPALEGHVHVGAVQAPQTLAQTTSAPGLGDGPDAGGADGFVEDVGRHQHQPLHPRIADPARMEQSDGGPVAVAHQHGPADAGRLEDPGQDRGGLTDLVVEGTRQADRVRAPVPGAAVDQRPASRWPPQSPRERPASRRRSPDPRGERPASAPLRADALQRQVTMLDPCGSVHRQCLPSAVRIRFRRCGEMSGAHPIKDPSGSKVPI